MTTSLTGSTVQVERQTAPGATYPRGEPKTLVLPAKADGLETGYRKETGRRKLGVLVARKPAGNPFAPNDLNLLRSCARQAALLLDRAMLQDEVAAVAVSEERGRLAREVHDGLAQHLAFLKMRVAWLRQSRSQIEVDQLAEVESVLEMALSDARYAISTLRAESEDGASTADAIPSIFFPES